MGRKDHCRVIHCTTGRIKTRPFSWPRNRKKSTNRAAPFPRGKLNPSCFIVDFILVLLQAPFFSAWKLFTAYWIIINSCAVCAPVKVSLSRDETENGGHRTLTERKCTVKLMLASPFHPTHPKRKRD